MRKEFFLIILASLFILSCSKDETTLEAEFSASVTGESPNAQLTIVNNSSGASTYLWTFGEGADISSSTEENPGTITIDKVGELSISLVVGSGTEQKELTKTVTITGSNGIATFSDIEFEQNVEDNEYGRFFSTSEGKMYKYTEINSTNGPLIDLVWVGGESSFIFFESPDAMADDGFEIPNATATQIINYESGFDVSVFDTMENDDYLKDLQIVYDDRSIESLDFPLIVLFENAAGKKGAIKLKAINSARLLVDIKVQKY